MTLTRKNSLMYAMAYKSVEAIMTSVQPSLHTLLSVKDDVTEGLGLILDKKAL